MLPLKQTIKEGAREDAAVSDCLLCMLRNTLRSFYPALAQGVPHMKLAKVVFET